MQLVSCRPLPPQMPPMSIHPYRRAARVAVVAGALAATGMLATTRVLVAQDFWLVPNVFAVAPSGWIEVRGQTGSAFPTSESVVALDRLAEADRDTHWATLVFLMAADAEALVPTSSSAVESDSAAVLATVSQFHAALAAGDSLAALALLTDDAIVLESGSVETRAEYRSHHLASDVAFARAVTTERLPLQVTVRGGVAWVSLTSTTKGEYRERPVDSAGAELVVLTRADDGWKIAAVHWSSRARRPN